MSGEWGLNDIRAKVAALESAPPGGSAWGSITGTLSAQTDLQTALNGKQAAGSYANAVHGHIIGDVTGLQAALDGKQAAGSYQPLAAVLTNTTAAFTAAQETKLAGIATAATANSSDAFLLSRANHTGTQAISTVTGLQTALDGKEASGAAASAVSAHTAAGDPHPQYQTQTEGDARYLQLTDRGATNGVAPLVAGLVPLVNLPSLGGGSDPWTWIKLAANNTVSTTAFANVTGLSFTASALTTYRIEVFGAYQAAATTTGIALALDIPAGATVIGMNIVSTSATALGGTEQVADATTTGATTGVRAANTNTPIKATFHVAIGATGGTVQLMQRSEVAASNTVLQAGLTAMGYRAI